MVRQVNDQSGTGEDIFRNNDALYESAGIPTAAVKRGEKLCEEKGWQIIEISPTQREARRARFASSSIGLVAGSRDENDRLLGFIDVDAEGFVRFILALLRNSPSSKKGVKGLTVFCNFESDCKNAKFRAHGTERPAVEIMVERAQTVMPPSPHPAGVQYIWCGKPIYELARSELPIVDIATIQIIQMVVENESASAIVAGGANVAGHDLMLRLASCGVAKLTDDLDWLAESLNALFHSDYSGDTKPQTLEMLQSAKSKNLGGGKSSEKQSAAQIVLDVIGAGQIETFHSKIPEGFASVEGPAGGRFTYPIRSHSFELWLKGKFYKAVGSPLKSTLFEEIVDILEAQALFSSNFEPLFLRYAECDGVIYVDLGDDRGSCVQITSRGWYCLSDAPVRFRRSTGMRALPCPVPGGDIKQLNNLLGLSPENWILVLAFILNCLNPNGPYYCLLIEAEQGSGKSVLGSIIKRLIDPHTLERIRLLDKEHDLIIQAKESALLNFDNTSSVSSRISDALCSLATRSAFGTRMFYTDSELRLIEACRPFILNGIGEFARRPDLLNRCIPLKLPRFEGVRRSEAEIYAEFEEMLPEILGSLYDIISHALKFRDNIDASALIRMADAARWLVAAEPACGLPEGTFVTVLSASQENLMADVVINDPLTIALLNIVEDKPFDGLMGQLFSAIKVHVGSDAGLPSTPAHLSNALKRLAPALINVGLQVKFGAKSHRGKNVRIWFEAPPSSGKPPSAGNNDLPY